VSLPVPKVPTIGISVRAPFVAALIISVYRAPDDAQVPSAFFTKYVLVTGQSVSEMPVL
jgi:hypothetical protein